MAYSSDYSSNLIALDLGTIRPCGTILIGIALGTPSTAKGGDLPLRSQTCTRRVLIIINLDQVRPVLRDLGHDHMEVTSCDGLPSLGRMEEIGLFTYHVLIHPTHIRQLKVETLLYYICQHIFHTWDCYVEPTAMDLRWQDITGDTFVLWNERHLFDYLHENRPQWTILFPNEIRRFENDRQPYIIDEAELS